MTDIKSIVICMAILFAIVIISTFIYTDDEDWFDEWRKK